MTETPPSDSPETPAKPPKPPKPKEEYNLLPELIERFPKAFVQDPEATMPLAIGLHKDLVRAGYKYRTLFTALTAYTTTTAYFQALADGKPRVNLDGEPVGEVSEEHRLEAAAELANPGTRPPRKLEHTPKSIRLTGQVSSLPQSQQKKSMPSLQLKGLQAKIAVTIDAAAFRATLKIDTMGAKSVPISIDIGGKSFTTNLNPKSFRKAQAQFQEAAQPVVSISGNLNGNVIEAAGIMVFDKGAKGAKPASADAAEPAKAPEPVAAAPAGEPANAPGSEAPVSASGRPKLSLKPKAKS